MMRILLFAVLIVIEVFLCILLPAPIFVNDRKYDRAFMNWYTNRTQETEATLKTEGARMGSEKTTLRLLVVGLLVLNTFALYKIGKRIRHAAQPPTPSYSEPATRSPQG